MAVGRTVWEVVKGIVIAVGKLLYLTGKLVICLFLLVLQLVLAGVPSGSRGLMFLRQCCTQEAGNRKGNDRCIGYGTDRIQKMQKRRWKMGSRLVWPAFFDEKMKRSKAMMKGKKKRLLAGTLALLLSCSTLLNTGITALASRQSEQKPGKNSLRNMHRYRK